MVDVVSSKTFSSWSFFCSDVYIYFFLFPEWILKLTTAAKMLSSVLALCPLFTNILRSFWGCASGRQWVVQIHKFDISKKKKQCNVNFYYKWTHYFPSSQCGVVNSKHGWNCPWVFLKVSSDVTLPNGVTLCWTAVNCRSQYVSMLCRPVHQCECVCDLQLLYRIQYCPW